MCSQEVTAAPRVRRSQVAPGYALKLWYMTCVTSSVSVPPRALSRAPACAVKGSVIPGLILHLGHESSSSLVVHARHFPPCTSLLTTARRNLAVLLHHAFKYMCCVFYVIWKIYILCLCVISAAVFVLICLLGIRALQRIYRVNTRFCSSKVISLNDKHMPYNVAHYS